ncbi:hypothetical protein WISP_09686 [Willisornis vidua]|uniref:Uncharacterized protein n=1 Tax=Willisornis vidua TaxID=1566151 RepID=A0ABQ9DRV8_9PASS|nr:hypothetical protein WISP_09686 [Willisornis vidua]
MPSRRTWTSLGSEPVFMRSNDAKCKVLHLDWSNLQYQYMLGNEGIESITADKDFWVLVDERLDMTQQCALTAQKASCVLGCIKSSMASRVREGILLLCSDMPVTKYHVAVPLWDWGENHEVRGPELDMRFKVWLHQCPVQGYNHCCDPAGHSFPDVSQDGSGLLGHLGTLVAHVQQMMTSISRSFSAGQLSSHSSPSIIMHSEESIAYSPTTGTDHHGHGWVNSQAPSGIIES